jgi:hypothetical protein
VGEGAGSLDGEGSTDGDGSAHGEGSTDGARVSGGPALGPDVDVDVGLGPVVGATTLPGVRSEPKAAPTSARRTITAPVPCACCDGIV